MKLSGKSFLRPPTTLSEEFEQHLHYPYDSIEQQPLRDGGSNERLGEFALETVALDCFSHYVLLYY
jgi:hypothetical protein